jgi:hypothetical protein
MSTNISIEAPTVIIVDDEKEKVNLALKYANMARKKPDSYFDIQKFYSLDGLDVILSKLVSAGVPVLLFMDRHFENQDPAVSDGFLTQLGFYLKNVGSQVQIASISSEEDSQFEALTNLEPIRAGEFDKISNYIATFLAKE